MGIKPIQLIIFPLIVFVILGTIYDSAVTWAAPASPANPTGCNATVTCTGQLSIISHNSPLYALLSGDLTQFWALMQTPTFNFNMLSAIITAIVGLFLLMMSLGITIQASIVASGASFGFNEQATKLGQVMGPGLLIWAFVSLALSGWEGSFNQFIVGFATLFNIAMELIYITGLFWMVQSRF
jgi:hypothetical protein